MLEEQIIEAKGRAGETGCLQAFRSSVNIANGIQVHGSIDIVQLNPAKKCRPSDTNRGDQKHPGSREKPDCQAVPALPDLEDTILSPAWLDQAATKVRPLPSAPAR